MFTAFQFDVIALLPLDLLYLYFGTSMVILRFPRLLKLQTFWEFHQAMDRVLSSPYIVSFYLESIFDASILKNFNIKYINIMF